MRLTLVLLLCCFLICCHNREASPDVSAIKIDLKTRRFEQDLFKLDLAQNSLQLDQLIARYPNFGENFLGTILSADMRWPADSIYNYVTGFINSYRSVYDTSQQVFSNFSKYEEEIEKAVRFVHHYFPNYKTPTQIITYVGPLDGYGDILSEDAFIIGLQTHLGRDYSAYRTQIVQQTYPGYISVRFAPEYIAVNCMKNIINDIYPEKNADKSLLVQMVEKGKRLFVLGKLLPEKKEYLLIGYSEKQLADTYKHEAGIWDLFIQNDLLQLTDKSMVTNYIGEGPKTPELGEEAPGNIGSFAGLQIVKAFMQKNQGMQPEELMRTDAENIFARAKYKP